LKIETKNIGQNNPVGAQAIEMEFSEYEARMLTTQPLYSESVEVT